MSEYYINTELRLYKQYCAEYFAPEKKWVWNSCPVKLPELLTSKDEQKKPFQINNSLPVYKFKNTFAIYEGWDWKYKILIFEG